MASVRLEKASLDDLPGIAILLRDFPYKAFQQKVQGLNAEALLAFFVDGMKNSLADGSMATWVVKKDQDILGVASLGPNAWHSRSYNCNIGRCNSFLSYKSPEICTPLLCNAILEEARGRKFDMVSLRIDGNEFENLHLLESAGFRLIDVSVKMSSEIKSTARSAPAGIRIRPYQEGDREQVVRISGDAHTFNHFFNDERLEREATRALFRAWVERCIDSLAKHVFVAEDETQGVVGFVTYLVNERLNRELGVRVVVLDYVVLDSSFQGRGLGPVLMEHSLQSLAKEYDQVELRTSHNNYPALALYNRYGMRIVSTDFQLHVWTG